MASAPVAFTPQSTRPWVLVWVLVAIYLGAFVDRIVLALLVDPIKADLGIGDLAMSLLLGAAFSVFYALFNLPAGLLIDRHGRRGIIAFAAVGWSAMTIVCGMADSYAQLFAGRLGVGLAEAFIAPAAFSLIRDRVSPASQGRAFSILAMAPYAGTALALAGGGALIGVVARGGLAGWPLLGTLHHWQAVLVSIGILGLPLPLLLLLVPADRRTSPARATDAALPFGEGWRTMRARSRLYGGLCLYATTGAMLVFGIGAWFPTVMSRHFGMPVARVGLISGPITLIAAILGLLACGFLLDRLRGRGSSPLAYGVPALILCAGAGVLTPLVENQTLAWTLYAITMFFAGTTYTVGATILARITPADRMGRVSGIYLLCQTLIGNGLGPTIVAACGGLFVGRNALGDALGLYCGVVGIAGVAAAVMLRRAPGAND